MINKDNNFELGLYHIYNDLGFTDLELTYNYKQKDGERGFSRYVKYHTLIHLDAHELIPNYPIKMTKQQFLDKAQHRSILDIEHMIDIDDIYIKRGDKKFKFKSIKDKAIWVYLSLKKLGIDPLIHTTSSKSYHISYLDKSLRKLSNYDLKHVKVALLEQYGGDLQLTGSRSLISLEGSKHYKSGKKKIQVRYNGKDFVAC